MSTSAQERWKREWLRERSGWGVGGWQSDRQRHRDMQRDGDGRRGERLLGPNNARTENSVWHKELHYIYVVLEYWPPFNRVVSPQEESHIQFSLHRFKNTSHQITSQNLDHSSGLRTVKSNLNELRDGQYSGHITIFTLHLITTSNKTLEPLNNMGHCADSMESRKLMKSQSTCHVT